MSGSQICGHSHAFFLFLLSLGGETFIPPQVSPDLFTYQKRTNWALFVNPWLLCANSVLETQILGNDLRQVFYSLSGIGIFFTGKGDFDGSIQVLKKDLPGFCS
jgi:hypothetical protein